MAPCQPKPIKILLVSDVHFGKLAACPEFALLGSSSVHPIQGAMPMKNHLISIVKGMLPIPQALFAMGDLTSIASPSEFQGSVAALREIAEGVGISQKNVLFTFGNHDVDWRLCLLANPAEQFPKDDLYHYVAAHAGDLFVKNPADFAAGPLPGSGVFRHENFTLFVLNSGSFCVSDQKYQHGKLGEGQLKWLEEVLHEGADEPGWRILMVHHHPFNYRYPTICGDISTLEEGAELVELAGKNGIDFVCHGHRHHPKILTQICVSWKKPVTYFCAGSLAVNEKERNNGQIPNLFHILSLETRLPNNGAFGSIQTFEYAASDGWRPINNCKETPLEHIHYFGALKTESELHDYAKDFLSERARLASRTPGNPVMLPTFADLPPELRCQPLKDLNYLIQQVAREIDLRSVGAYPEEIALFPK